MVDVVMPEDLAAVANKIVALLSDKEITEKPRAVSKQVSWEEQLARMPSKVSEWSPRDFVHWFAGEMKEKVGIPYSIKYARDISKLNEIIAEMKRMGLPSKEELKAFLDWAFEHNVAISRKEGVFSLTSIMRYINEYMQTASPLAKASDARRPKLGYDLLEAMEEEGKSNATLGILKRFGIPLTAAYFENTKDLPRESTVQGIAKRLGQLLSDDKGDAARGIFERSISNSPYPEWMPLTDWRSVFEEQVRLSKSRSQKWWRQSDFEGLPFEEYDSLSKGPDLGVQ